MKKRQITVREFEKITINKEFNNMKITKNDIDELKLLIDEECEKNDGVSKFLCPIRNGVRTNNYVGVLQLKTGLTIEILPKIIQNENISIKSVRKMFLKMLSEIRYLNGMKFNFADLSVQKTTLLEVFIRMFIDEVNQVINKGLKSNYVESESNEKYFKGRLIISKQIQKNSILKNRFYIKYDEFLIDCPENQIIKATLKYVYQVSKDLTNQKLIKEGLTYFDNVCDFKQLDKQFLKIDNKNRQFQYYKQALSWCSLFLNQMSFTGFTGNDHAFSILFPMETIYELYIASIVKKVSSNYKVETQERKIHLYDSCPRENETLSSPKYLLKPDIVLYHDSGTINIIDTKWKILDKYGPSQSDMYQMYAYSNRYRQKTEKSVNKVILLYPKNQNYEERSYHSYLNSSGEEDSIIVETRYIDCLGDAKAQMKELLLSLESE